jgi:hypothetical protein
VTSSEGLALTRIIFVIVCRKADVLVVLSTPSPPKNEEQAPGRFGIKRRPQCDYKDRQGRFNLGHMVIPLYTNFNLLL